MSATNKPSTITGGCLCEAVRYKITFPHDHDFLNSASTCQCSQCRKQTGSLIYRVQKIPKASLVYEQTSPAALKTYSASAGRLRGFCGTCGSFLTWYEEASDKISVCVGTFDREYLKEHGTLLTYAERHWFCEDEIEDVTSHLKGKKWKQGDENGGLLDV